jgi:hypothetical protein
MPQSLRDVKPEDVINFINKKADFVVIGYGTGGAIADNNKKKMKHVG